jgi:hypothetical protein
MIEKETPEHVRVLERWAGNGYEVEERFPFCGYVYFGSKDDTKRVFWSMTPEDELTPNLELGASWGFPTERERLNVIRVLADYYIAIFRSQEAMKARGFPQD